MLCRPVFALRKRALGGGAPSGWVIASRRFEGTYRLRLHGYVSVNWLLSLGAYNNNNDYYYNYYIIIIIIIIVIIIIIMLLSPGTGFSPRYFSWTSGDPHRSGFKFQTVILSVLCVMFQVLLLILITITLLLLLLPHQNVVFLFYPQTPISLTSAYYVNPLKTKPICFI
jgi:hypothetical protein